MKLKVVNEATDNQDDSPWAWYIDDDGWLAQEWPNLLPNDYFYFTDNPVKKLRLIIK